MSALTDREWQDLRASLKTSTRDRPLAPGAVAAFLNKALRQCSLPELAAALEFKDQSTLRKIANLEQLPPDLLGQVTWGARMGTVSMSVATLLQQLNDPTAIRAAFTTAANNSMSRDDARKLVRSRSSPQ